MRVPILAAGLAVLLVPVRASAQEAEFGLITRRAPLGQGLWATFARPVQVGQAAELKPFRDGAVVAHAKVKWVAPVAPYEALLVDVELVKSVRPGHVRTPYQRLFQDRPVTSAVEALEVGQGYIVSARAATRIELPPVHDPLQATMAVLSAREEWARVPLDGTHRNDAARSSWDKLNNARLVWNDAVTARLVERARDLFRLRNRVGGTVPGDWFPPVLAREKAKDGG